MQGRTILTTSIEKQSRSNTHHSKSDMRFYLCKRIGKTRDEKKKKLSYVGPLLKRDRASFHPAWWKCRTAHHGAATLHFSQWLVGAKEAKETKEKRSQKDRTVSAGLGGREGRGPMLRHAADIFFFSVS